MSFYLWTGVTFALFHWAGNSPVFIIELKIIFRALIRLVPQSLIILADIPSGPWAFLMSRFNKSSLISSSVTKKDVSDSSVRVVKSGSVLEFSKGVHWSAKYLLKRLAFSLQSVMYSLLAKRGGILGSLHLFRKLFRILQSRCRQLV